MVQDPASHVTQEDMNDSLEDMNDIWMGGSCKHGKNWKESAWKETKNGQETSTGVNVLVNNFKSLINKNIQVNDHDIQRRPKKNNRMKEIMKDFKNCIYAKVVDKFLSLIGKTPLSRPPLVLCLNTLIVPIEGFKDLKEDSPGTAYDSGIHSNLGPVLLSQDSGDLQVDSPPQIPASVYDLDRQGGLIENAPGARDPSLGEGGAEVRAGDIGRVVGEIANDGVEEEREAIRQLQNQREVQNQRGVAGRQEVFDPLPLQYLSTESVLGVRIGDKQDHMMFVSNIGTQPFGSGIFLNEYAPMYGIRRPKNSFAIGNDYVFLSHFQPGKMVYLNQCVTTGMKFVSKWVPIVPETLPAGQGERSREKYVLQHKQQVELVVGEQDWCSGLAKIHGVIKRFHNGREFVEVFMEYCQGGTFHDNMSLLGSLTMTAKWRLAQKILDIVEHLHRQTIVHGDLKYANMASRDSLMDVALIDFESGKHPNYKTNMRATYLFLPPWFGQFFNSQNFHFLKTMDMWSLGIVLLKVIFGQQLWEREHSQLQHCDSCNMRDGTCLHVQAKFLCLMKGSYPHAIKAYLPYILPDDDPVQKRLACLLYGLLPLCGPRAQLTAAEAKEALEECMVVVLVLKEGRPSIPPVVVEQGTLMKTFIQSPQIRQLKYLHPDLEDGMWFTAECQSAQGRVKEWSVTKNHKLTESCVLHVYPPIWPLHNTAAV